MASDRQLPVADGVVASGDRPSDGPPGHGHSGTGARDVVSKSGLRVVVAPEAGTVVDVYSSADPERPNNTAITGQSPLTERLFPGIANPWMGYGPGGVVIAGDSGAFHLLAHLARQDVALGARVAKGEQVGVMPSHVGASRSHVHWEVRKRPITTEGADRVDGAIAAEAWLAGGRELAPAPGGEVPQAPPRSRDSSSGWGWFVLALLMLRTK